jgi:hypothetical protein
VVCYLILLCSIKLLYGTVCTAGSILSHTLHAAMHLSVTHFIFLNEILCSWYMAFLSCLSLVNI